MKQSIILRAVLDILLLVSVIFGWWFGAIPLGLIGLWLFSYYAEGILAGIAYDALFGMFSGAGLSAYAGTSVAVILTLMMAVLKKRLRHS